ncbi:MAG: GNAT family N-acetyltransferase [Pseudomonadota bacterium]
MSDRFQIRIATHEPEREAFFTAADAASDRLTPFQSADWLKAWYGAFPSRTLRPLLVSVHDRRAAPDEGLAFSLPLVRRWRYGLPVVEFADRGVTDYNLPIPGPAMPRDPAAMMEAFASVSRALRPHVRFALHKMPAARPDGTAYAPLPTLSPARAGPDRSSEPLTAYICDLGGSADAFAARLGSKKCKDLRRRRRALAALGHEPAFRFAADAGERRAVLDLIARSQHSRYGDAAGYLLDRPRYEAFYQGLACGDAACSRAGFARLAALWMGDRPVAGLLALVQGGQCVVIRLGMVEDAEIARAGPGKLLLHAFGDWAAGGGIATLDLSLGHNDLKAWFRCRPIALKQHVTYANGLLDASLVGRVSIGGASASATPGKTNERTASA